MPKILPPTNRPKVSGLGNKTKMRLVTDALIQAASSAKSNILTLVATEENKLNQLQPHEIIRRDVGNRIGYCALTARELDLPQPGTWVSAFFAAVVVGRPELRIEPLGRGTHH